MLDLRPKLAEVGSKLSRAPGSRVFIDRQEELLSSNQLLEERERMRILKVIVLLLCVFEILEVVVEIAVVDNNFAVRLFDARRCIRSVACVVGDGQLRLMGRASCRIVLRILLWQTGNDPRAILLRRIGIPAVDRSPRCQ